jgi:hypothetical protein
MKKLSRKSTHLAYLFLLSLTLLQTFSAHSAEFGDSSTSEQKFDIDLSSLSLLSKESGNLSSSFIAKKIFYSTESTYLELEDEGRPMPVVFSHDDGVINLSSKQLKKFRLKLEGPIVVPAPMSAKARNISFNNLKGALSMEGDSIKADNSEWRLALENFKLDCSDSGEIALSCLKSGILQEKEGALKPFLLEIENHPLFAGALKGGKIQMSEKSASVDINSFSFFFKNEEGERYSSFALENASLSCTQSYIEGQFDQYECLNDLVVSSSSSAFLFGNMEKLHFDTKIKNASSTKKSFSISLENSQIRQELEADEETEAKKLMVSVEKSSLSCQKFMIEESSTLEDLLAGCAHKGVALVQDINVDLEKTMKVNVGTVQVETVGDGESYFMMNNISMSFEQEQDDEKDLLTIPRVRASCQIELENNKLLDRQFYQSCVKDGFVDMPSVHYKNPNDLLTVDLITKNLSLKDNALNLEAKTLDIVSDKTSFNFKNIKANCKKEEADDIFNMELLQERCFDSSIITIDNLKIKDSDMNMNINVKSIGFDKTSLSLNVPSATYDVEDKKSHFEDLSFKCDLDAQITHVKDLDWRSIVKNCLLNSKIELKKLDDLNKSSNPLQRIISGVSSFLLKMHATRDMEYTAKDGNFTFSLTPKTRALLIPIKTKAVLEGQVKVMTTEDTMKVKFKISKFDFDLMAFNVESKNFLFTVINLFVKADNIHVEGDEVVIDLMVKE